MKDHSHTNGCYRGPSCNECNLKAKVPSFLPVFFHNLSGYDSHLFVTELGTDDRDIDVIPQNTEKYISFSKKTVGGFKLRFLDSFRFMPSSLESLAKNLHPDEFHHIRRHFSSIEVPLVLRKGVYPYDYMDTVDKFDETSLPPKEAFYNRLNEEPISDEDYVHAEHVWDTFQLNTLGQYSDLYLKTDVLLLTDIFQNFRKVCMDTYHLDPAWYYTSPGLSWDAMLKMTGVELELLTDYDMLLFVERGIRGGISQCSHRYGYANNPFMSNYDDTKPSNYLLYLDANNLYGWAMSQPLPLRKFQWIDSASIDVMGVPDDGPLGYILEVDLKYGSHLHDDHSDLPLCPETSIPPGCKEKRLLTTLHDKKSYVLHYRNLKQCLQLGLKLEKIHKVLQFHQTPWLKSYIDLNTHHRSLAKNEFEKKIFKLMNNSIFGKTMENIRRRVDIRLCNDGKKAEKLIAKPNFLDRTIFSENLVAFHMRKAHLIFNKPITIGMSIMELSKTLMYSFHYEEMKPKYGDKLKLMYMDTDSFIYDIEAPNVYEDMKRNIRLFDTSDYPLNNMFGIPLVNKKVLGKMKDECQGEIMTEFIGLRSKMYTFIVNSKTTKKCKGIKKSAIKSKINFSDYKNCLFNKTQILTSMNLIRSKDHKIYSVKSNKLALSPHDQKRYVLDDGIQTLPFGHYSLQT